MFTYDYGVCSSVAGILLMLLLREILNQISDCQIHIPCEITHNDSNEITHNDS